MTQHHTGQPAAPSLAELMASSQRVAPVSLGQRRLWFVDRLVSGGLGYSVVWPLRLLGGVDVGVLCAAVGEVVGRHEVLRSRFVGVDGEPVMVVDPVSVVDVPVVDVSAGEVSGWVRRAGEVPFDLAAGPVVRWVLLRVSPVEHVLLFSAHHIVFDGWSGSVLLAELAALYEAFVEGRPSPLEPLPVQFADFVVWERQWLSGDVLAGLVGYWRGRLAGAAPVLDLPTDWVRPVVRSGGGARCPVRLSAELVEGLQGLCRAEGATVFMGVLAGLNVVLGRYARSDDVLVGTFVAGRGRPELERLIGFFVNTVVLRTDLSGRLVFREVLGRSRDAALGAFAHAELPFDRVVEELAPVREPGVTPFLQVALVMQNTPEEVGSFGDVRVESLSGDSGAAAFDLAFHLYSDSDGGLAGFCEYATDVWCGQTVQRLVGHVVRVLEQGVRSPDGLIEQMALTTATEHHQLRAEFATGASSTLSDQSLAARFARIATDHPDATAYIDNHTHKTYRELARSADRVARRLQAHGISLEEPVGVCLERGFDLPAAVLGIWQAGGAYVPLDPDNPAERLRFMLTDAGARTVLTTTALRHLLPENVTTILVDQLDHHPAPADPPTAVATTADQLACVIYTSGSTGQPKGVAITGRAVANRVDWLATTCPPGPGEVGCLKTPIGFVDSLWELLGGLLHGVPTVVVPAEAGRDPRALVAILGSHHVTRLLLVPSLLRMLLTVDDLADRLPQLTLWISSGEPLPADLARRFQQRMPGRALHNLYGSAEAWDSVWSLRFTDGGTAESVPVGYPVANVDTYVFDRAGQLAPIGITGELYVGGDCLARGYVHQPARTAERFVPHPFQPGARLYRTGDLARYLPDGQLQLVGRADHQLKVRGFRVEPGEVERALETLPQVRQAVVVGWSPDGSEPGETELAAYVVAASDDGGHEPVPAQLRAAVAELLPPHLVPTSYTVLAQLPTTATGKVDRGALPAPQRTAAGAGGGTTTAHERLLARLWSELLDLPTVGIDDNFFDIGGHSLVATRLADRLSRQLGRDVPVRFVFDHSTVRSMASALTSADWMTLHDKEESL